MISSSKNCKGDKCAISRPTVYLQPISGKFLVYQIKIKEVNDFLLCLTCSARNNSCPCIGHFPTNFSIWTTKIHFGWPNFLYIFNGTAISNL